MTKFKLILFSIILSSFAFTSCHHLDNNDNPIDVNTNTTIPIPDLIAHWNFDYSNVKDYSGKQNDATIQNNVTFVKGIKGKAAHLEGRGISTDEGDHILLPDLGFNNMKEFTISMWVKEESKTYEGGVSYFFYGNYSSGWLGIMNHWGRPRLDMDMRLQFASGANYEGYMPDIIAYQTYLPSNEWSNIWCYYTMTYNNGIVKAYKNSILIGTFEQKVHISENQGAIGRHWWSHETATRMTGDVDEVRVYSRALKQSEINQLYDIQNK